MVFLFKTGWQIARKNRKVKYEFIFCEATFFCDFFPVMLSIYNQRKKALLKFLPVQGKWL